MVDLLVVDVFVTIETPGNADKDVGVPRRLA